MSVKKEMKDARLLMTHFDKKYKETYNKKYIGNSHQDVWGFRSMMEDLGFDGAHDVINYYFKTKPSRGHEREHLLYNYHTYAEALEAQREEHKHKAAILRKMKEDFGEG